MKPRNREVNIFNMSLLDILCGALGAFCFMMLVLFPYWKPGGANAKDIEQEFEKTKDELDSLRKMVEKMPNVPEGIMQQFANLEQKLLQQQGQLNRALQQLEEADKAMRKLEMRNPIVVLARWTTPRHDVSLFLQSSYQTAKGEKPSPFDPTKKQFPFFAGETSSDCNFGPCSEIWMIRDAPPGETGVYYALFSANENPEPAAVSGFFMHDGVFYRLPPAKIEKEKTGVHVGTIIVRPDYKIDFRPEPQFAKAYEELLEADKKKEEQRPQQSQQ